MNTFKDLRKLKKNWNDYNAEPLIPEYIDTAEELYAILPANFEIFPLADGGVQLEYEDKNVYIEFVIEDKIKSYWNKNDCEGEETFTVNNLVFVSEFANFIISA